MIALVDYGAGNLTSVRKALTALGADFMTPDGPPTLNGARAVIVPGVGHFAATSALESEWREAIGGAARAGTPLLGICVGMQWLFEGSDEAPEVHRARRDAGPHRPARRRCGAGGSRSRTSAGMRSTSRREARLLRGLDRGAQVYFTHSYAAPVTAECVAATTHANTFAAVVERDNIFGVQFHPEKSGDAGLQILRNFLELARAGARR